MFTYEDRIKRIIGHQLDRDFDMISPEFNLVNDLGADSLDIVELVMCLEEEFDIEILDDEAETLETVGDIIEFIEDMIDSGKSIICKFIRYTNPDFGIVNNEFLDLPIFNKYFSRLIQNLIKI